MFSRRWNFRYTSSKKRIYTTWKRVCGNMSGLDVVLHSCARPRCISVWQTMISRGIVKVSEQLVLIFLGSVLDGMVLKKGVELEGAAPTSCKSVLSWNSPVRPTCFWTHFGSRLPMFSGLQGYLWCRFVKICQSHRFRSAVALIWTPFWGHFQSKYSRGNGKKWAQQE